MEKRGLVEALKECEVTRETNLVWEDEMRVGLHGKVRRVWAPRGVKLRRRVEMGYEWRHLALGVDMEGRLRWKWLENVRKESVLVAVNEWREAGVEAMVVDNAPGHRAKVVQEAGMRLVFLPPYAPELNPPERIFEELRQAVEGQVYGRIEKKVEAVERKLLELNRSPKKVRNLASWSWIQESLEQLPTQHMTSP